MALLTQSIGGTNALKVTTYTYGSGTFTPQVSGGSFCRITLVGGGAAGQPGVAASGSAIGGGGGGAGATIVFWKYVTAATNYSVGGGGLAHSVTYPGQQTSFGTLVAPGGASGTTDFVSSYGGLGGGMCAVPVSQVSSTNATGYFAASSNVIYTGFQNGIGGSAGGAGGNDGNSNSNGCAPGYGPGASNGQGIGGSRTALKSGGGGGGDSPFGSGGDGGDGSNSVGGDGGGGTGYGSGGGGGGAGTSAGGAAGAGADGLIIIEEFGALG